jgi:hypothetical protein
MTLKLTTRAANASNAQGLRGEAYSVINPLRSALKPTLALDFAFCYPRSCSIPVI